MHKFLNTTHRSIAWFKKTNDAGSLIIKPPFQRNPVWSLRQQSALMDTILMEYPIPEIYMQEITDSAGEQQHILVDGQQRIRTILSFVANGFEFQDEKPEWEGMMFDDSSELDRKKIFEYSFVIRLLPEMPDEEIRAIFQRLNKNTMALNGQELRHATYWGPFIKLMEEISDFEFWSNAGIFSANERRRMLDIEFISELAVAVLNGLQNKKTKLEEYYQQYETEFEDSELIRSIFNRVLGEIEQLIPNFSKTRWRKKSDFYTIFVNLARHFSKLPLASDKRDAVSKVLVELGNSVDELIRNGASGKEDKLVIDYFKAVQRAASDLGSRRERDRVITESLKSLLN